MRESMHHGLQALARPELRVEQPLGGVIEDGDQGLPLGRLQRQPRMRAAIEMQPFTVARPRLAASPMPTAGAVGVRAQSR